MTIHIVQPDETVYTIADKYNVPANRIILDNDIDPNKLAIGQTLLILYPTETYIVKQGDTLEIIAKSYNIPQTQLLRNNNFLFDRKNIYPGEELVISYNNNKGNVFTNGYINPFVDIDTFKRSLPYLSYISIFGYRTSENANIISIDDTELIKIAKAYGVAPLMSLSTFTFQGISDINSVYDILINENLANKHIENIINILKDKGYYGLNITYQFLSPQTIILYKKYTENLSKKLRSEGFKLFITVSPKIIEKDLLYNFDSTLNYIDNITLMDYNWGKNFDPPSPVTSIKEYDNLLNEINEIIPDKKINIGCPIIGYDWELPYIQGTTIATSLKLNTAIELAQVTNSIIKFDEISQTPYFNYTQKISEVPIQHIVWFIDARTINSVLDLITKYNLNGTGIWSIMFYSAQIWSVINSQYKIEKLFPEP